MKIAYGSDLHLEFYGKDIQNEIIKNFSFHEGTDLIVIAGDLHVGAENVIDTLKLILEIHDIPIVYVPGNHEYYHSSFEAENKKFLSNMDHDYIHILLKGKYVFGHVGIFGCYGHLDGSWKKINRVTHGALNDFRLISDFDKRVELGESEREYLRDSLRNSNADVDIVVTHTMPSPRCISEKYKGSHLNPCFANDWEKEIVDYEPKYWICGHTHDIGKTYIHNTEILINPMGYPGENKNWDWRYIDV